jgi:hypothetical protein
VRDALVAMRAKPLEATGPRGATPAFDSIKHGLRDWIDAKILTFPEQGDEHDLQNVLNAELSALGLICEGNKCPVDLSSLGYLDKIRILSRGQFLVVITAIGIECGEDESAYLYSRNAEGWHRVWENEQTDYTDKKYEPQTLQDVLISGFDKGNEYVVLTLGMMSWCASAWHPVYYRAFRLGPDLRSAPLIDGSAGAFIDDIAISGYVTNREVLVEYAADSIDSGVLVRQHVRHYLIDHDKVQRVAPLALGPHDFVDEWLKTEWRESAFWSESLHRGAMLGWHTKLHKDFVRGGFHDVTTHCATQPDLWQVSVDFEGVPSTLWFTVRWRPPYKFSMVNVSTAASPLCREKDPDADGYRTLFPISGWR